MKFVIQTSDYELHLLVQRELESGKDEVLFSNETKDKFFDLQSTITSTSTVTVVLLLEYYRY
jgi:hypothetical protein